jgi:NAD(P)-dependent dehydrogenase (short-subunit alcohol dehydrogenase family)
MPPTTQQPHAGRIALVTGAASGIGQIVALGLAQRGATVIVAGHGDLTATTDLITQADGTAIAATLDISDPASIETLRARVADEHGHLDILVNNAGIFEQATWDQLDLELWQQVISVDLTGTMLMCKAFLPLMQRRGWGRVINVSSATVAIASPVSIAYRTSKMAVVGFSRALSATVGDDGITVNAVLPSLTRTPMTEGIPEPIVANSLGRQVIHRMAEPEDIAGGILMLASDDAGWITGQSIMANGGNAFGL